MEKLRTTRNSEQFQNLTTNETYKAEKVQQGTVLFSTFLF